MGRRAGAPSRRRSAATGLFGCSGDCLSAQRRRPGAAGFSAGTARIQSGLSGGPPGGAVPDRRPHAAYGPDGDFAADGIVVAEQPHGRGDPGESGGHGYTGSHGDADRSATTLLLPSEY